MKNDLGHTRVQEAIRSHFRRGNSRDVEHSMFEHISECDKCRSVYEHYSALTALDPDAPSRPDRLMRGLGLRQKRSFRWVPLVAAVAAVSSIVVFIVARWQDNGFHSRGPDEVDAKVLVYRVTEGGSKLVVDRVSSSDALAFAYENPSGLPYLMVFARRADGHVYWYYPSWTDPDSNPSAVEVTSTTELYELGAAIRHDLEPGKMELFTVFADQPWRVRNIEAILARQIEPFELRGARVEVRSLTVEK